MNLVQYTFFIIEIGIGIAEYIQGEGSKSFFKRVDDNISQYIFVLAMVFFGAFLAELAGIEAIIGAFLAGLSLNRLIPRTSALMNRVEFVGNAIFIPFFLIGVGMLIDYKIFFKNFLFIFIYPNAIIGIFNINNNNPKFILFPVYLNTIFTTNCEIPVTPPEYNPAGSTNQTIPIDPIRLPKAIMKIFLYSFFRNLIKIFYLLHSTFQIVTLLG